MTEDIINTESNENPQKQGFSKEFIDHQWQPGQSGNPGGKVAGKSITAELRKLIEKGTNAEDMAKILYEMSRRMSPDQLSAFKELLNRTDGKVPDTHKIESDVPINIVYKQVGDREDTKEE